jgi:hypothetical protein
MLMERTVCGRGANEVGCLEEEIETFMAGLRDLLVALAWVSEIK